MEKWFQGPFPAWSTFKLLCSRGAPVVCLGTAEGWPGQEREKLFPRVHQVRTRMLFRRTFHWLPKDLFNVGYEEDRNQEAKSKPNHTQTKNHAPRSELWFENLAVGRE